VGPSELDPPLRVDWITAEELGDPRGGRLGLTFLPGKRGASTRYPGRVYRRDLDTDLATLAEAQVDSLVLLVDDDELARFGDADIVERASARGVNVVRRPMPDGTAPATAEEMDAILAVIDGARQRGDVAVACMGGVGRTGTVVACALVAAGLGASTAIARVRAVRHPEAVETAEQVRFVGMYERHMAARTESDTLGA
jgi:protein-tyrosine phosphatase